MAANKTKRPLPKAAEKYKFKPGQSGNPLGGKLHNPIKKALANLTVSTYREVIEKVLTGNLAALREMVLDEKTPAIQVGVAQAFIKAMERGDYTVIREITAELVGTLPKEFIVKSQNQNLNATVTTVDAAAVKEIVGKLESDV